MPRSVKKNMEKILEELKKVKGKEIYKEDLILLIEESIGVGEQSAKMYIKDLVRRRIVRPLTNYKYEIKGGGR